MAIKKVTKRPPLKFIDRLHNALKEAGITVKRGGMTDWSFDKNGKRSERQDDNCEWVRIILKNEEKGKKYEVEFFFTDNSKKLESVLLYVKKKKKGYGSGNLIGRDKPKEKIERKPPQEEPYTVTTSGFVTITISDKEK